MQPQRKGVIGDRDHRERRDGEGQSEPQQAVAQKDRRRLVPKARPDEQSGQEKEHRHEEAVGGGNDGVEADPRLGIGVTEIGVGNDGMVDDDHKGQERAVRSSAKFRVLAFGAARVSAGAIVLEIDVMRAPAR